MNRQLTIAGLTVLIAAYAFHAHGLFALYHLLRAAELIWLFR